MTQRRGNMIVEVLVGISIAAIVIVSVGNLVSSVNRSDTAAANKVQALAYAQQSLELTAAIAQGEFQCTVGAPGCTCTPLTGYTKCWQACPTLGCDASNEYHLINGGAWHLASGRETPISGTIYDRWLTITSVSGVSSTNLKNVVATVRWTEGTRTRTVTEMTQISGWKQ